MLARQLLPMLRPHRLKDARKVRVGRHFDGGYVMLDRFAGMEAAYSLGINDETSWDFDMAQRGLHVYQYDHTIDGISYQHPLFHWFKIGISGRPEPEKSLDTLERLVEANGHSGNRNLILKCDIEGAEWDMLINTPNSVLAQFSQIVVEMHNLDRIRDPGPAAVARAALINLCASHRVVHVHANNYAELTLVGGYPVPATLEVTLARVDLGEFSPSDESFPTPLDMPCNGLAADIHLGRFEFV